MDWLQWLTASGAFLALGLALAAYLKTRPQMKLAGVQADAPLWTRIAALEVKAELADERLLEERRQCDERIERIEKRHQADVAELKRQVSGLRHDRNNVRQGFNAMLAMIKRIDHPEMAGIAATIEDMVSRGDMALAAEKAVIDTGKRKGEEC